MFREPERSCVEQAVVRRVVSLSLGMQTIQGILTGRKLEDKYYDLNFSPSSDLLPEAAASLTQPETRRQRACGQGPLGSHCGHGEG